MNTTPSERHQLQTLDLMDRYVERLEGLMLALGDDDSDCMKMELDAFKGSIENRHNSIRLEGKRRHAFNNIQSFTLHV